MVAECRPPARAGNDTPHWVRCTRSGEFLIWRWVDERWVTGPMSKFSKSPAWTAAQGYVYVSAWLPSFVPTEAEATTLCRSLANRRGTKFTVDDQPEVEVKRRIKRYDRASAKQVKRVASLGKTDHDAEQARVRGVTYLPLKLLAKGRLNVAQYSAAARYQDEVDIRHGVRDATPQTGARFRPAGPGGAIDRQVNAAEVLDQADAVLGRDGRDVVVTYNTQTSGNTVAAMLQCSRDTAEARLRAALDRLDRFWSCQAPPDRRQS